MNTLRTMLRHFTIHTRMRGAVLLVLALFLLVGATALVGGSRLKSLNRELVVRSMEQQHAIGELRGALGDVRRWEKDMVIDYEDGIAVLKAREAWAVSIAKTRKSFETLLAAERNKDDSISRKALERLDAYAKASEPVLQQIQNGGFDTAKGADRMLAKAKEHVVAVEQAVDAMSKLIDAETLASQREFDQAMLLTLYGFGAVLGIAVGLVVPLTLLNAASIVEPI